MANTTDKVANSDSSGEKRLRGGSAVDDSSKQQLQSTDQVLRTDGEEDTLYEDGLELENNSKPLKGINGKDDT